MATVTLDTGGSIREYVQVKDGKVFSKSAIEFLPEACSDFFEIGTLHYTCVFPAQAALELDCLRAQVASGQAHQVAYWRNEAIREQERTERAEEMVRQLDADVTRLRQWIAGLDEIDHNPGPHRKWADVSSWIPSGQTLFMGPPPPQ